MKLATSPRIPTYTADGRRYRDYSLAAVERMLKLSMVVVRRDGFGRIRVALFRGREGRHPMLSAGRFGQRYSLLHWISEYCRCYEFRPLLPHEAESVLGRYADAQELDRFVRDVFLQVPLSVIVAESPKVVSIDAKRARRLAVPELLAA